MAIPTDPDEEDRRCQGFPDAPCIKERGQLSPFCEDCEHENRIRQLEAKYQPLIGAKEQQAKPPRPKKRKSPIGNEAAAAPPAMSQPAHAVVSPTSNPTAAEKSSATPAAPTADGVAQTASNPRPTPDPKPEIRPPAKPTPFRKCTMPACWHGAEDGELCRGCYGTFKIWRRYTLEGKPLPIILTPEQIARFQAIAAQAAL